MENYLPLPEAARRLRVKPDDLYLAVGGGKIRTVMFNGQLLVCEADVMARIPVKERPEYQRHNHLIGIPIGMREASRKYRIPVSTISRYSDRGFIQVIGTRGKQGKLLDEADVAYCAEVYHSNRGQGRWLFNPDGTPYKKQS